MAHRKRRLGKVEGVDPHIEHVIKKGVFAARERCDSLYSDTTENRACRVGADFTAVQAIERIFGDISPSDDRHSEYVEISRKRRTS